MQESQKCLDHIKNTTLACQREEDKIEPRNGRQSVVFYKKQ